MSVFISSQTEKFHSIFLLSKIPDLHVERTSTLLPFQKIGSSIFAQKYTPIYLIKFYSKVGDFKLHARAITKYFC